MNASIYTYIYMAKQVLMAHKCLETYGHSEKHTQGRFY